MSSGGGRPPWAGDSEAAVRTAMGATVRSGHRSALAVLLDPAGLKPPEPEPERAWWTGELVEPEPERRVATGGWCAPVTAIYRLGDD